MVAGGRCHGRSYGERLFWLDRICAHGVTDASSERDVSRSSDSGRTWSTQLFDQSSAPRGVRAQGCETGFLGAQIALASDASGALYALWNAGLTN